jgi:CheY-like chemotaxis protein
MSAIAKTSPNNAATDFFSISKPSMHTGKNPSGWESCGVIDIGEMAGGTHLLSFGRNLFEDDMTPSTRGRVSTILVVDDHVDNVLLLRELLTRQGYLVNFAGNAEDAELILKNEKPDLLLLDVVLPGKSGYALCEELKKKAETELIPIIMISGLSDLKDKVRGIEAGADDFLPKPIFPTELFARISSLLRHKEAVERRLVLPRRPPAEYDAFISHAHEDKDYVRPLVDRLIELGIRVWYDDFELRVGQSLRRQMERGLTRSNYGIVVLSPHFFAKKWPQEELNALMMREGSDREIILPVWHNLTFDDIRREAPMLLDRYAARSLDGLEIVLKNLLRELRPDVYESMNLPSS